MWHKERGSALISALMLILMIASISALWMTETHYQIIKLRARDERLQVHALADAAKFWAVNQLQGKKFQQTHALIATNNGENLALPKGWKIQAKLSDAQSIFNINSISEQGLKLSYFLLLKHLLARNEVKDIFFASISWLQNNQKSSFYNAIYAKQKPPYQNSEQAIVSLDELKYINGFTPDIINKLKPYLTALPESTPININTADETILSILKPNLKPEDLKKIIYARGQKGFKSSGALFEILESFHIPPANVTINSQYFWLEYAITSPNHRIVAGKCLYYRPLIEKKAFPKQVIMVHELAIN